MAAGFDAEGKPTGPALIEEDAAHALCGAAPGTSSSDLILARPGRTALEASCDDRTERDAWLDAAFAALALCPPRSMPTPPSSTPATPEVQPPPPPPASPAPPASPQVAAFVAAKAARAASPPPQVVESPPPPPTKVAESPLSPPATPA